MEKDKEHPYPEMYKRPGVRVYNNSINAPKPIDRVVTAESSEAGLESGAVEYWSNLKPILRRMVDMTKNEVNSANASPISPSYWCDVNGFDIYGLIDSGVAIDAKTLEA